MKEKIFYERPNGKQFKAVPDLSTYTFAGVDEEGYEVYERASQSGKKVLRVKPKFGMESEKLPPELDGLHLYDPKCEKEKDIFSYDYSDGVGSSKVTLEFPSL